MFPLVSISIGIVIKVFLQGVNAKVTLTPSNKKMSENVSSLLQFLVTVAKR